MSQAAQQKNKDNECWTTQHKACFYTQLHRFKTLRWKSVQWIGGFFNVCKVWKKAKKVLPLIPWWEPMICRDSDLERGLNWHGFLKSYSQPFYKLAEERSTPKGAFPTRTFSDRFLLLPPVVAALNLMSSSKLTVHRTYWTWTTPEIELYKPPTSWIFFLLVKNTTEILTVAYLCLAFRLQINSHTRKGTKWKERLLTSSHFQEIANLLHKMKEEITSI